MNTRLSGRDIVIVISWLLAASFLTSKGKREDKRGNPSNLKESHPKDRDRNGPFPPYHKYHHYTHPSEEEHRTAEQFSWRDARALNLVIAFASMVAAGFAIGGFVEARRQAEIAEKALFAGQRPWIAIQSVSVFNGVTYDANGFNIALSIKIKNVGRDPAISTNYLPFIFFRSVNEPNPQDLVERLCDGVDAGPISTFGIVFPEADPEAQPIGVYLLWSEIEANRREIANANRIPLPDFLGRIGIAFCIAYKAPDGSVHRTGRLFDLTRVRQGGGLVGFRYKEAVPQNELALQAFFESSYAN